MIMQNLSPILSVKKIQYTCSWLESSWGEWSTHDGVDGIFQQMINFEITSNLSSH